MSSGSRLCLWAAVLLSVPPQAAAESLSDYIKPLVGTSGHGNTFPGPSAPFGMVQLSPDTEDGLWETASGYQHTDPSIMGFSLTHLSGTGIPDLGDFLFMPQVGEPKLVPGPKQAAGAGWRSLYSHDQEEASAGYYKVKLLDSGVTAELTAGRRAGLMRFTFPRTDAASILTDMTHVLNGGRWKVAWSRLRVEDASTVTGFHLVRGWAKDRPLYFAARYSRPFDDYVIVSSGQPVVYNTYRFHSRSEASGDSLQFLAKYKTREGAAISVKVAISAVSARNALGNLDSEIPGWDFEGLRRRTRRLWDKELARIEIEGTREEKETFYTALYHAFLAPNLYEDVTGEYLGLDHEIHRAKGFVNHAVFSLWDTYRAEHPLLALIQAPRDADMINSMLAHYDQSVERMLPIWSLQANETWCMIGYHAVSVIADAYLKGVGGFDARRAYAAARATALNAHYDSLPAYDALGWVPFDKENESVSKTLEYAYDDYCVGQMAKALGKRADAERFLKRSGNYRNLYDASVGAMRGKDSQGRWREPFDAHLYAEGGDITEGTSAQYSFSVQHDVPGLISLMGGAEAFVKKLDALFASRAADKSLGLDDVSGRIGEYWHGNEPSHHIAYLYTYAGQPWKTAQWLGEIVRSQYGNKPDSLSGNDDCGQMSAWYLFTALGFYPIAPASGYYTIGRPFLRKAAVHLSNGKTFTVTAENLSEANPYVQSVRLNGKSWDSPFLPHAQVAHGGTLAFVMGPRPSRWAMRVSETAAD